MEIQIDSDAQAQAISAGYANVQEYIPVLMKRDRDRLAIQQGHEDVKAGRLLRPYAECDVEMRHRLGIEADL